MAKGIRASASASVFPINIQGWFPLGLTGLISLQSKGLSRVFSSTTVKSINSLEISCLYGPTLTSIHDYYSIKLSFLGKSVSRLQGPTPAWVSSIMCFDVEVRQDSHFLSSSNICHPLSSQPYIEPLLCVQASHFLVLLLNYFFFFASLKTQNFIGHISDHINEINVNKDKKSQPWKLS